MKSTGVLPPEVIAIVDLSYARGFEHWLHTIRRLSDLPRDPALCVQIRAKTLSPDEVEKSAKLAREAFQNDSVILSWNGDPAMATTCGYDACHQSQANISKLPRESAHLIHSASVHDEASLKEAETCGVDFAVFGPVFEPHWKKVHVQGIDELKRFTSLARIPVLAIGGINLDTVTTVSQTNACGVACLSGVMDAQNPIEAVVSLKKRWRQFQCA